MGELKKGEVADELSSENWRGGGHWEVGLEYGQREVGHSLLLGKKVGLFERELECRSLMDRGRWQSLKRKNVKQGRGSLV